MATVVEICAGAGGMAIGLERAGWNHLALVEFDALRCQVLRRNRPHWPVLCTDMKTWEWAGPRPDLLAGGVPCQPASRAGKRKLNEDARDLWPELPALIERVKPRMICFENVPGVADNPSVRDLSNWLNARGWGWTWWKLNAADFGVPQTRERWFFVALEGAGILMEIGPQATHSKTGANGLPLWRSVEDALQGDYGVASSLPRWLCERISGDGMVSGKNANKGFQCDRIGEHGFQTKKNASNGFMDRGPLADMPTSKQTRGLDEPSFTLTKEMGRRHRIVRQSGTLHCGGSRDTGRSLEEPAQTMTGAKQSRNIVMGTPKRETRETREPAFTLQAGNQVHRIVTNTGIDKTVKGIDEPLATLTGNRGKGDLRTRVIDGLEVWAMTERQLQRLQAFPDDWGGMTTDMIGDAVPPPMAEAVARRLLAVYRPGRRDVNK